jgi:hypothetical protein
VDVLAETSSSSRTSDIISGKEGKMRAPRTGLGLEYLSRREYSMDSRQPTAFSLTMRSLLPTPRLIRAGRTFSKDGSSAFPWTRDSLARDFRATTIASTSLEESIVSFSREIIWPNEALRLTSEVLFDSRSVAMAIISLVTLVFRSVLRKVSTILATNCKGKPDSIPSRHSLTTLP